MILKLINRKTEEDEYQAIQFTNIDDIGEIQEWLKKYSASSEIRTMHSSGIKYLVIYQDCMINIAEPGDYIIKNSANHFNCIAKKDFYREFIIDAYIW